MATVKQLDKRSGITYVYESVSYWDKEKKQPRSKRTLIGRLGTATGTIVPTDGRGKRRTQKEPDAVCQEGKPKMAWQQKRNMLSNPCFLILLYLN